MIKIFILKLPFGICTLSYYDIWFNYVKVYALLTKRCIVNLWDIYIYILWRKGKIKTWTLYCKIIIVVGVESTRFRSVQLYWSYKDFIYVQTDVRTGGTDTPLKSLSKKSARIVLIIFLWKTMSMYFVHTF